MQCSGGSRSRVSCGLDHPLVCSGRYSWSGLFAGLALVLSALPAFAADPVSITEFDARHEDPGSGQATLPAVSAPNLKFEAAYGHYDLTSGPLAGTTQGAELAASLTVPIGVRMGLQADVMWSDLDGLAASGGTGIGGHFFWRDPGLGMAGAYGHRIGLDGITLERMGGEAEVYLGDITLSGFLGVDRFRSGFSNSETLAAEGRINWYATGNLMLSAGFIHAYERTNATAGFEMMLDTGTSAAPSLFAEASLGENDRMVRAGIRFYVGGQPKSLKQRHREDDPAIRMAGGFGMLESHVAGLAPTRKGGGGLISVPIPIPVP